MSVTLANFPFTCFFDNDTRQLVIVQIINILGFRFMVFNAIFNNISDISWRSVVLVEETGISGENHRPAASH